MRFVIKHHQFKELPYRRALEAAGWIHDTDSPEVVLIDFELPHPPYLPWIERAKQIGARLMSYPHGFTPVEQNHLIREPYECAMAFVHGPGQALLRAQYDYPNPVHWIGRPGPNNPLKPRECRHVLFAPHHPLGSGWMPEIARKANTEAYRLLLKEPFDLSVRMVGTYEQNGIWPEEDVEFIFGQMDGTVNPGDVVVAGGTYAANCLSLGIPVVMYHQSRDWWVEIEGQESKLVPGWAKYHEYVRYPFDLGPGVCQEVAENPAPARVIEWMEHFMPPFQPDKFVRLVEECSLASSPS